MRDIALIIVVLGLVPHILKRPFWGLIMWVVFSLMNPHRLAFGFAYELPFAQFIALLTLASLVLNFKTLYPFPVNFVTVSMILLVLWINVSSLLGQDSVLEHILWMRAIKVMIMVMITFWVVGKREEIHYLAWALALSVGFYGIKGGLFTIRFGGGDRVWGPPGTFISDNNALALAIVMAVPLFRYLQLHSRQRWLRIACVGAMLLCVASAAGSQSRGALLAMAGMGMFLWLKSPNKAVLGVAGIIVAFIIYMNMPESWHSRMSTIATYEQDQSAMGRINAWGMTWNLAVDYFPIGGGFDLYTWENFGRYAPDPLHVLAAHSIYFQILGEHGFVGLALFLAVFIGTWRSGSWIIRQTKKHPDLHWMRDLAGMCQVSLVGYAVGGAFLSLSYYDFPYYVAAMLVITRGLAERHLQASRREAAHGMPHRFASPDLQKLHLKS